MTALITRDDLAAAIEAGAVTVVDALGGEYFARQHLPGALPLIPADVDAKAPALLPDRDAAIVTYCSNPSCPNSGHVAARLAALGYTNVRKYREGIQDWPRPACPPKPPDLGEGRRFRPGRLPSPTRSRASHSPPAPPPRQRRRRGDPLIGHVRPGTERLTERRRSGPPSARIVYATWRDTAVPPQGRADRGAATC
ncbi:rhodanese-like domain-containing protein [Streptomyces goshikiensis]|uniref:rhodanese-like domain-containing protein n=1 Tax=Streptomyces goshikiensis TaxID=1942 RepID=UPI00370FE19A